MSRDCMAAVRAVRSMKEGQSMKEGRVRASSLRIRGSNTNVLYLRMLFSCMCIAAIMYGKRC